jgi:stage II sporulation protein P
LIDIHRDDARKALTTKMIHNKSYARLYFIVGMESKNNQRNMALANSINTALEQKYPGISREIFPKYYYNGNGVCNQDLSSSSLLVEIGGVDNTLEELNNSIEALAQIFSQQYS